MPDPVLTPASWLALLCRKLDAQALAVQQPINYFNGVQKLSFATAKFREAFSRYFPPMANNWMKLVVEAPVARLGVQGFRFNPDPSKPSWDEAADADAWAIWQANNLDAGSDMAHTEAIKCGVVNVLVSPPPAEGAEPLITIEHPQQTYVFCSPENRMRRLAAIKRWHDEDGYAYATVYLPRSIHRFSSASKVRNGEDLTRVQWTARGDVPSGTNPIGVVPMIPLENNPDLVFGGRSDLETAMPLQDAINKLCLDMQVSSEFHAFPQRYATGWEKGVDPVTNKELSGREVEIAAGQSRLWRAQSPETTFGQLEPGEVNNYIAPIEMYVDHLAAVTQTPAYYLKGKMANLSADAIRAADAGLNDRVGRKQLNFGDGWEEVLRVAFRAKGDMQRGRATTAETLWKPSEVQGIAELVDAAVKMRQSLSLPLEMCWELLGFSPQKIRQAKSLMNLPDSPAAAATSGVPSAPAGPDPRGLPAGANPTAGMP